MTRAQYEAKYGKPAPVPAPVKMTRAQYNAKYNPPTVPPAPVQIAGANPFSAPNNPQSYLERIKAAGGEGIKKFQEGIQQGSATPGHTAVDLVQGVGKIVGGAAEVAFSPFSPAVGQIAGPLLSPIAQNYGKLTPLGEESFNRFAQSPAGAASEGLASTIVDYSNAAGLVAGGAAVPRIKAPEFNFKPAPEAVDSYINAKFDKGIKPTISNKNTAAQNAKYKQNVVTAVKTIKENEPNLKFFTEDGELQTGRAPQTRQEFADAIGQTKSTIYNAYDALATQAGKQGAKVDTANSFSELDKIIKSEAMQLTHPEIIQYAKGLKARFEETSPKGTVGYKKLDTKLTQDIIENYNTEHKIFWRNPTYNHATRVAIEVAFVRDLRGALDRIITSATGSEYQALRSQYAALKAIEADVIKSSNRAARLNPKGLLDYTDIFSGGDIVHGILSLNPALFAKGVAQKGFKEYFKYLNDPDRAVSQMFQRASSQSKPLTSTATTNTTKTTSTETNTNVPNASIPPTVPYSPEVQRFLNLKKPPEAPPPPPPIKPKNNGGYIKLPSFGGKKLTTSAFKDQVRRNVSDALQKWKGPADLAHATGAKAEAYFRLEELKAKDAAGKTLTSDELLEVVGLLREEGVETIPGVKTKTPIQDKETGKLKGSRSSTGTASSKGSTANPTSTSKGQGGTESALEPKASTSGRFGGDTVKFYHGSKAAEIIDKEGFKLLPPEQRNMVSAYGEGVYLTASKADAKGWGGVVEAHIPKDLKLFKAHDSDAYKINTKKLKAEGYDGVELVRGGGNHIVIFDPAKIKTKSQLSSSPSTAVPKELEPLAKEARKYKSADAFIIDVLDNNTLLRVEPDGTFVVKPNNSWDPIRQRMKAELQTLGELHKAKLGDKNPRAFSEEILLDFYRKATGKK